MNEKYVALKKALREGADDLAGKVIVDMFGVDYKGLFLFGTQFSETSPDYVPKFAFGRKAGHWDYAGDFRGYSVERVVRKPRNIKNPWQFDEEIREKIMIEIGKSHKSTRFVQWVPSLQPPPTFMQNGNYEVVNVGYNYVSSEDARKYAPMLVKSGGIIAAYDSEADSLLHEFKGLSPFFRIDPNIFESQFLIKTK